jgi:hypothetical protein
MVSSLEPGGWAFARSRLLLSGAKYRGDGNNPGAEFSVA